MSQVGPTVTKNLPRVGSRKYLSSGILLILTIAFAATTAYLGFALVNANNQNAALKASEVNTTYLTGTVSTVGTPVSIVFWAQSPYVMVSSAALYTANAGTYGYEVFLDNGAMYHVVLYYAVTNSPSSNGIFSCNATPYYFSPPPGSSVSASQNFSC